MKWQLQDAKNKFSELVNRVHKEGPQVVTKRGIEDVVVLDIMAYRKLIKKEKEESLNQFFLNSPLKSSGLTIERSEDNQLREVEFG